MPLETVQALLTRLIDYAGLFPPASLSMRSAVGQYARYHRSREAWLLGRFIVPCAHLEELEHAARRHLPSKPAARPWSLSVLVGDDLPTARERINFFNRRHTGRAVIEAVELKPADAEEIARAARVFEGLEIFYELPHVTDPGPLMAAVAAFGGRAKIRTGGVTADAFPTHAEVIRFLRAAERCRISFKATAGLHHPLRGEHALTSEADSPKEAMHGFLNLFLAAAWVKLAVLDDTEVEELLEERDGKAFSFTESEIGWRDHRLATEAIVDARRRIGLSFGSCSFAEPVKDLRALKLL